MIPTVLYFVNKSDVQDEDLITTVGDNGHKLRITVYNTYPEKVVMANCARVTSRDHYATNGIVHIVDKVKTSVLIFKYKKDICNSRFHLFSLRLCFRLLAPSPTWWRMTLS